MFAIIKTALFRHQFVVLVVGILSFQFVIAEDLPDWVKKKPASTIEFKYYVGRSPPSVNDNEAFKIASGDAYSQAIKENFGVTTAIESESSENLSNSSFVKRTSERSDEIRIVQFEQVESHLVTSNQGVTAYVLYRFPISEIVAEKKRLKEPKNINIIKPKLNLIGDADNLDKGSVEIYSVPPGAEVKIDHKSWGVTPVKITGSLELGEHLVDIVHPDYDPELNQEFILIPNKVRTVKKILKRKETMIDISTEPSGAVVSVNGKPQNKISPLEIKATVGDTIYLSFTHPETNPQQTKFTVTDHVEVKTINLVYKLATLTIDTHPSGADILIDGKYFGKTGDTEKIVIEHGQHSIKLSKTDYIDNEISVVLKGGENKVVPTVLLGLISETEKKKKIELENNRIQQEKKRIAQEELSLNNKQHEDEKNSEEASRFTENPTSLSLGFNIGSNNQHRLLGFYLDYEKRFKFFGICPHIIYQGGSQSSLVSADSTETTTNSYTYVSGGVSIFAHFGNFSIGPDFGYLAFNESDQQKASLVQGDIIVTKKSSKELYYGINAGYFFVTSKFSDFSGGIKLSTEIVWTKKTGITNIYQFGYKFEF